MRGKGRRLLSRSFRADITEPFMNAALAVVDRVGVVCSRLAGWLFFAIGLMITYEVVARLFLDFDLATGAVAEN